MGIAPALLLHVLLLLIPPVLDIWLLLMQRKLCCSTDHKVMAHVKQRWGDGGVGHAHHEFFFVFGGFFFVYFWERSLNPASIHDLQRGRNLTPLLICTGTTSRKSSSRWADWGLRMFLIIHTAEWKSTEFCLQASILNQVYVVLMSCVSHLLQSCLFF